ncbi:MAG TPA: serine/threonine-protein kinase [Polyangia bacterium]|nr:serine/threonine-protein kinase [Polyangia bacterium]
MADTGDVTVDEGRRRDAPTESPKQTPGVPADQPAPQSAPADASDSSEAVTGAAAAASHAGAQPVTYHSPREALHAEEVTRARNFMLVIMVLCVVASLMLPLLGGDPVLKAVFFATLAGAFVSCGGFWLYIRDPARFLPEREAVPAVFCTAAAVMACQYFGVLSAAEMIFMMGIYYFSLGSSRLAALVIYLLCALLQGAALLLQTFDVLPDLGLLQANGMNFSERLASIVMIETLFLAVYLFARKSREAEVAAVEGLEAAHRQIGQREALLQEANQALERALEGGYQGRWTGQRVGPWQLQGVIGRGAMGEVYEGQHTERTLPAAVKLLHREVQAEVKQMRRFMREAQMMAQIDSPHVVKVHDVSDGTDGRPPYIAMELLHGHNLAWYLRRRRRLAPRRVADMVSQVARALDEARKASIVHRDLKPQNLFLSDTGGADGEKIWKVLDFGVSRLGASEGTLTRGHIVGTPGYMAPEQASGHEIDHRTDVFALAVIAYRALTGRPAFAGEDLPKIVHDIVYVQPARPGDLVLIPDDVELVLAIGMAKQADDRFARAVDFAEALALAVEEQLPQGLRERGQDVLAGHPWGK